MSMATDLPELFFTSGPERNRLYRNLGRLRFEDATEEAGISGGNQWSAGAAMADVDGDGDLDIYVCQYDSANELWINNGNGKFSEQGKSFGLNVRSSSLMPYFIDYDGDSRLDLFLLTNAFFSDEPMPKKFKYHFTNGKPVLEGELARYFKLGKKGKGFGMFRLGQTDLLYRNQGTGGFKEVTRESGIERDGNGLSASWFDCDGDSDLDLYVGNDFKDPDHLFRNNGNGTFTDIIKESVPYSSWFTMGSVAADFNNDSSTDLFCVDMAATTHYKAKLGMGSMTDSAWFLDSAEPRQYMRNTLLMNTGTPRFLEIAQMAGVDSTDWSWAPVAADFDGDGWTDLFVTNGVARDFMNTDLAVQAVDASPIANWNMFANTAPRAERNMAFRNRGGWKFDSVAEDWGLDTLGMTYGAATGDLDGDGDLDLVTCNLDDTVGIYANDFNRSGSIVLTLDAGKGNRFGVGTKVSLITQSGRQSRVLNPQSGFLGSHEPIIHFAFGDEPGDQPVRLEIHWPDGSTGVRGEIEPGHRYHIVKGKSNGSGTTQEAAHTAARSNVALPLFAEVDLGLPKHAETAFDDFAQQPLLPNKMSQLGPGVACADVNGDGLEDIFVSSARGQTSAIALRRKDKFELKEIAGTKEFEDMAPLFFDADVDGDVDLLVVSGGVESGLLQDRLYLNDGKGNFAPATDGALPGDAISGGPVAAADLDRDGDLDLIAGARVLPGRYPRSGRSRLLRNDSSDGKARFVDVTGQLCPDLENSGLVTSALWSDANGDGWQDLLITTEWGPVKLFINREGKSLEDATAPAGLSERRGWWNGIAGADFDGDGDIDYAVTNFGTNTKYTANDKKPARIYYGSFAEGGPPRIVEAKVAESKLLPVRGRSCSTHAIPQLGVKFPKYHDFASATLEEIYTPEKLANAEVFEINELRSGILLNDGAGKFVFRALPNLAQVAPGFGIVASDLDGDGLCDLAIAQNFYTAQRETGRMSAGLGIILLGDGKGTFTAVEPARSGMIVHQDAKGLAISDLNGDARPDLVMGVNDGPAKSFENRRDSGRPLMVRLRGPAGNPDAVGARLTLVRSDGRRQTSEVSSGGSYLSQSTGCRFFSLGEKDEKATLEVTWPDGKKSEHELDGAKSRIEISWPTTNAN